MQDYAIPVDEQALGLILPVRLVILTFGCPTGTIPVISSTRDLVIPDSPTLAYCNTTRVHVRVRLCFSVCRLFVLGAPLSARLVHTVASYSSTARFMLRRSAGIGRGAPPVTCCSLTPVPWCSSSSSSRGLQRSLVCLRDRCVGRRRARSRPVKAPDHISNLRNLSSFWFFMEV